MMTTTFRKLYLLVLLFCFVLGAAAQQNGRRFMLKGTLQSPAPEVLSGATLSLKDSATGKLIAGGSSNADGSFSFTLPAGNYVFAVSYLGTLYYQSNVIGLSADTHLGTIKISPAALSLKEIVIQSSANKPAVQVEGRKLIYNVQNSITAQGSNALEALKKTPGVMVNQDNTITLNGSSGALVMVNGRQTYLQAEELAQLLKSMAASDLKAIEVIKNPSAEYDAAGTGGIINLVLKKSMAEGFNGNINAGLAYGYTFKQNTNLALNYKIGKLNLFANYNHNFGYYQMNYDNDRTTNGKIYLNANEDIDKKHSIGSALGGDYVIDSTQTIGIVVNGNFGGGGGIIRPVTNIYDQYKAQLLQTLRSETTYPNQESSRYNANINYRFKGSNNTNLDIDADYGIFDGSTENLNTNSFYSAEGQFQSSNDLLVASSRYIKLYAVKADYGFPVGKGKMFAGAKFSSVDANNVFDQYDANGSVNIIDVNLSNTFRYKEQISAGYLKYETPINKTLSLDAGLRLENTHSEGKLTPRKGSTQQSATVNRNYLDLFPTLGLTYKTKESGTFNLSFARRVGRPAYSNLNPFAYPVDELSYWKGNPFLQPQYANSIFLLYSYKSLTLSPGYTHTTDVTSTVTEIFERQNVNMTPRNIGMQNNFSLTVTEQLKFASWWNVSITGIGYRLQNKVGTAEYGDFNLSQYAGTLNIQQNLMLPGKINAELAGVINSKSMNGLNTYVKGNSQIDLGLQRSLFDSRASLRLSVSDVMKKNKITSDAELNNLILHTTYRAETRQVRINFSYRFGDNKAKRSESRESGLKDESERL
jgi:hypothetical protein